ncbi:MAG TPA: hypothetical protein DCS67_08745 [Clostridiales bacterium UBA8960]|jgi:hypothetical protein|nr:hypothetical protein [Clostridiales bacterium UBA8960]
MIKVFSVLFVLLLGLIFIFAMLVSLIPNFSFLNHFINYSAIGLLAVGIILIIVLIRDRFIDSKKEGDDYKKF